LGQSLTEAHQRLYHYTTAAGLQGIVESQQLRATNISYLNDVEEHIGFFDRRFPQLFEGAARTAIAEIASTPSGRSRVEGLGGAEGAWATIRGLGAVIRDRTLEFNTPYITSFCSAPQQAPDDGLLSQWRGYGLDGGYAVVFETQGINQLLIEEAKRYNYQTSVWGDVEYYEANTSEKATHPETLEHESNVRKALLKFIPTFDQSELEALYTPLTVLSCLCKHRGFREESEVRIVAVPVNNQVLEAAKEAGEKRPRRPVQFTMKDGVLVPYIDLFGHQTNGELSKLPISSVIVGPHSDRLKRQRAVELLLEQHEIDAKVIVSEIPYVGR